MRNVPVNMINAVDTVTQTGPPVFVGEVISASFTPVFGDTTAVGTVQIQESNVPPVGDPSKFVPPNGSFSNIPNATSTIAAGVGSAIVLTTLCTQYVRAVFTYTSGGSSTVVVNATFLNVGSQ
jgi:hypothetical protein